MSDTHACNSDQGNNFAKTSALEKDSNVKPDAMLEFSPKPKRKPRINRRSYFLDGNTNNSLLSFKEITSVNGCGGVNDKKTSSAPKKIISFESANVRERNSRNTSDNSSNKRKNSFATTVHKKIPISFVADIKEAKSNSVSSSAESPPKKKHKPITWP